MKPSALQGGVRNSWGRNNMPETKFSRLGVSEWRQFSDVEIEFHPRLTILTGANATGKSTLLGVLARHFNWNLQYSSAPQSVRSNASVWSNLGPRRRRRLDELTDGWAEIGSLDYSDGSSTQVTVPHIEQSSRQSYDVHLPNQQAVKGVYLDAHRSITGGYAAVSSIPTNFASAGELLEFYIAEVRVRWAGTYSASTPQGALKQSLIASAAFGNPLNENLSVNREASRIWVDFQHVLAQVLPKSLQFRRLHIRLPDVIVECGTGDFVIDDASGGVSAIIEIAWQIYLTSRTSEEFVVLIDEPENHLHPSLQRDFIPGLLRAFPRAQFIVSTHSPFVVTASPESAVYALDYSPTREVFAHRLDYSNKAASAEETLTRVLGMPSTAPIWAETKFNEIMQKYLGGSLSRESVKHLRDELVHNGFASEFPDALVELVSRSLDEDAQ